MRVQRCTDSFTRPANTTTYADGDLVANDTTAGNVVPLKFHLGPGGNQIMAVHMTKSDEEDVSAADFAVHTFGESPTPANGDNGSFSTDSAQHFGELVIPTMHAHTDVAMGRRYVGADDSGPFSGTDGLYLPDGFETIFMLVEAKGAYEPASGEVFTVHLDFINYQV